MVSGLSGLGGKRLNARKVDAVSLTGFVFSCLIKAGLPEDDAHTAADMVVVTDLRGIDSHGVARFPNYIRGLKEGRINPNPETSIFSRAPATALMDGDRGLGFIVGHRAMTEAMRRAETNGAGFVSVRNSNHFGAGGNYSMMALKRDMIGISMTVGLKGMVAPGGSGPGVGINVLSVAAPSGSGAPFVLDMATTVVAAGKVEIALREGKELPEGWAVDSQGKPIRNPKDYFGGKGSLTPLGWLPVLGSYKGFGLGIAVDIFCSLLSGAPANGQTMGNHFFGAFNIAGFLPVEDFKKAMDEMMLNYRSLPKAPGVERIILAGEPEWEMEKTRRSEGIPLNPTVVENLKALAKDLGVETEGLF
jgi:L-2-hydroxycarboxylate dehydrogenase (NAD+)